MNNIYIIIILVLTIMNILFLILGFVLGKLSSMSGVISKNDRSKSFFQIFNENKDTISIDDKIYVTDIKTDGMVKKYNELGEVKQSNENITSSINKLKQMKGNNL